MTDEELLQSFSQTLGDLLGATDLELTMDTLRSEVPGWDSFNYINFIVAIEMTYNVKFKVADVESFKNVGQIVTELKAMLA